MKEGKRLTEQEQAYIQQRRTLIEIDEESKINPNSPVKPKTYIEARQNRLGWIIYFDFEDYKRFKSEYPDYLEFFDHPVKNINEYLKVLSQTSRPKIDWATFAEYHREVMAYVEWTKEKFEGLQQVDVSAMPVPST